MASSLTATNLSAIGKSLAIPRYGARDLSSGASMS
jgi:hypothetical protein